MDFVDCKRIRHILISFAVAVLFAVFPGQGNTTTILKNSHNPFFYKAPCVAEAVKKIGPQAEARIKPFFDRAGLPYPSRHLAFIALKAERKFEVWAENEGGWTHVRTYDILAASGRGGPKQRHGDCQVPEGIYQIIGLNPASRYHLSMKINYPNKFDRQRARDENRTDLGGDIFIHGKKKSSGCLALGDTAIEELFVLVAKTGPGNVKVVISPRDMRKFGPIPSPNTSPQPSWLPDLYMTIGRELAKFKVEEEAATVAWLEEMDNVEIRFPAETVSDTTSSRPKTPLDNLDHIEMGSANTAVTPTYKQR